jgi:hypothetical protein
MTGGNNATRSPAATSPAAGLPRSAKARADHLRKLLVDAALARRVVTEAYARAYLEFAGTDRASEQAAKLASAAAQLKYDTAKADVERYRLLLDMERWAVLGGD